MIQELEQPISQAASMSASNPEPGAGYSGLLDADAVHELANLVMVVSGSLKQLRRQPLDEEGQQQIARAEWGARQLAQLTRRVLSQAQGGDGTAEALDLNAAVRAFVAAMGQHVTDRVRLASELAPGQAPVRLDPGLLELVLLSLVRNAASAMPDGGTVTVRTRGPQMDGLGDQLSVELSVSAAGKGMTPDASVATERPGRDAGLGLRMAQRFVHEVGGKMDVEATPGQGITVRLAMPYAGDAAQG